MKHLRAEQLKKAYNLQAHPEGGWFAEVYTAPFETDGRALAGSIYFLLDAGEVSQFHQIDCEELWFYHEGCGVRIAVLHDGELKEYRLGPDCEHGQRAMVAVPKDAIFSAENLMPDGFTFVSCVTAPKFRYEGFRLVGDDEIREKYPNALRRDERTELRERYLKKAIFYYDGSGLLTQYPTKKPLREIVLSRIAARFAYDTAYTEKQVNQIIAEQIAFSDIELIRRELYEGGYLDRLRDGSKYWKLRKSETK